MDIGYLDSVKLMSDFKWARIF